MHDMTAGNLRSAHGGESMAHMRYLVWGEKAAKDGFPKVARLFRAIAHAERVHAWNHFAELRDEAGAHLVPSTAGFGLGTTSRNLEGAIEGEMFEVEEMYPAYLDTAKSQKERGAQLSFHYALSAERIHAAMYQKAKQAVDGGADLELGPVQICEVCGYTAEGEAPDKCPICTATREQFRAFA
jgi:rubrerythrin